MRRASWMSLGMMVTRLAWIAHRLVSSKRPTRYASEASCRATTADDWKRRSVLKSWAISRTRRWNGSLRIRSSVDFWYLRISRRATVPGLRRGSAEGLVGHRAGATGLGQARLNRCGLRAAAASPPPCALAAEAHTARGARQRHARQVQRHIARAGRTWIRCSSACALGRTAHLVRAARHPPGRRYAQREVVALRLPAARVLWDTLRRAGRFFQPGGAKAEANPAPNTASG